MRVATAALIGLTLLSGCNRAGREDKAEAPGAPASAQAEPVIGFQHEAGFDAQGYYKPLTDISVGQVKLVHIAVGAPSDFDAWEGGKHDEMFGPILVEFEDASTPLEAVNGVERRAVSARVLPLAYRLTPGRLAFHGQDAKLGDVEFDGAFDTAALAEAKAAGLSEGKAVATGRLTIGKQSWPAVKLGYWAGD